MSKNHVIVEREIYTNLFSVDIFASTNQEQNVNFKTDNSGNLIFADVSKDVYIDAIKKAGSELYKTLNEKNENVNAETIQRLYESFAKFRYSLACYLTGQENDGDIYNYFKYAPWASNKKIRDLKSQIYEQVYKEDQLEKLSSENVAGIKNESDGLKITYSDIENEKCRIFKKAHPAFTDKFNDEQIIDIIFKIERQQALLDANEVFFKNMILKSRDKNFLTCLGGKSFDEFLRDEKNHLVNFVSDTDGDKKDDVEKYQKEAQNSSTGDIYKIKVKDKNYFIKIGNLFLDTLDKKKDAVTGKEEPASEVAVAQEMYRGTTTKKIYDEVGNKYLNKSEAKQNLVDTGSHGLLMNAFANIFDFGVNVLVNSAQIVSSTGNHILMKEAQGKLFNDLIEKCVGTNCIQLRAFINLESDQKEDQELSNLLHLPELKKKQLKMISEKQPPSCNLQNSIIEINILDYIFSNADRNVGNIFVTQDGIVGIDQDISSPTEDKEYHKKFIINYTKDDLPNLIPYATKSQYDKIKTMVTPAGKKRVENTIKMWIKTVDEDTLNSVVKIILKRIDEICAHFKNLDSQKKILETKEGFDKQTALEIAEGSIQFRGERRLQTLEDIGATNVFNGAGAIFWADYNDAPKPKMKNGYDKDSLI